MQKVQAAAQEIDKATSQAADIPSTPKQPATHVVIDQPTFKLGDSLRAGSMVLLLVFFLLLAGDTFKRKLVRLTGPTLSDKKITVHILDDISVSILIAVATGMVGFIQFESFSMALLVSGSSLAITTLVGIFVVTWMTGKMAKLNAMSVFVALLFWGWLWGVSGLLLAIPILGIVNVVSPHIEELQPLAELLRD
jgi:predicted PurR-regulated permease PerM